MAGACSQDVGDVEAAGLGDRWYGAAQDRCGWLNICKECLEQDQPHNSVQALKLHVQTLIPAPWRSYRYCNGPQTRAKNSAPLLSLVHAEVSSNRREILPDIVATAMAHNLNGKTALTADAEGLKREPYQTSMLLFRTSQPLIIISRNPGASS